MADPLQHRAGLLKALRIAGIAIATLLVIVAAIVTWALHSESGTRALLGMARGSLPAGMSIDEVGGTVAGTLRIRNFRYHDPELGLDLAVESVAVDLAPLALLSRRLHVERAEIEGVLLTLFPATAPVAAPPENKRDPWQAPLDMRFDELLLVRGELRRPQAAPFRILRASVAGSWSGTSIEASKLTLESPDGTISLAARIGARAPKLQHLQAEFRWRAGEHQWAGTLGATGANQTLELSAALDLPLKVRIASTLAPAHKRATGDAWRAHLTVERFDPHPLITTDAFETMALELDAEGNLEDLALRGVLTLDENRIHLERLVLARRQELLQIAAFEARLNSQPAALTGSATLALDGSKPASVAARLGRIPAARGLGGRGISLLRRDRGHRGSGTFRGERQRSPGARRPLFHPRTAPRWYAGLAAHRGARTHPESGSNLDFRRHEFP